MNHVNDIAFKVRDQLRADPAVWRAEVVQGEPRTDCDDYPNRDGEWLVLVGMRDGRYFRLSATALLNQPAAIEALEEAAG